MLDHSSKFLNLHFGVLGWAPGAVLSVRHCQSSQDCPGRPLSSLGGIAVPLISQNSFKFVFGHSDLSLDSALRHRLGLLGCPEQSHELDSVILMGPFQHSTFHGSKCIQLIQIFLFK